MPRSVVEALKIVQPRFPGRNCPIARRLLMARSGKKVAKIAPWVAKVLTWTRAVGSKSRESDDIKSQTSLDTFAKFGKWVTKFRKYKNAVMKKRTNSLENLEKQNIWSLSLYIRKVLTNLIFVWKNKHTIAKAGFTIWTKMFTRS